MTTLPFTTLAVGDVSPFPSPGVGAQAIATVIHGGVLTLLVQLPGVLDEDLQAIKGEPVALALHQNAHNPLGTLMVVLRHTGEDMWPLKAPLLDADAVMLDWAAHIDGNNILLLVLVDSRSNTIRALRTVGLPRDFLAQLASGIRASCPVTDREAIMRYAAPLSVETVWTEGIQWTNDPATDTFVRRDGR